MGSLDYVASYCRLNRHDECSSNPVVTCACPCHGEGPEGDLRRTPRSGRVPS